MDALVEPHVYVFYHALGDGVRMRSHRLDMKIFTRFRD